MGIYEHLGVRPMINAAGTYTVAGGSKMSAETLDAMREAAGSYVDIPVLQQAVHRELAALTKNEAAYVSNGAATGLYLCVAAAIQRLRGKRFFYMERDEIAGANIVMFKAHRNPYDLVIGHLGAAYRELAFPNVILPATVEDLEQAIDENTAAVLYAECGWVAPGALPLEDTIRIAKSRGVPVIVDAAAQLPPLENLWRITGMGAEAVLFSGGKDLKGPQASGLVVGTSALLDIVADIGFPHYGIGRMMKVGREEMVGLYAAVRQYVLQDYQARRDWCEEEVNKVLRALEGSEFFRAVRSFPNEAGQPIPRAFVEVVVEGVAPEALIEHMGVGDPSIYVKSDGTNGIFVNPMTLEPGETELVIRRLLEFTVS